MSEFVFGDDEDQAAGGDAGVAVATGGADPGSDDESTTVEATAPAPTDDATEASIDVSTAEVVAPSAPSGPPPGWELVDEDGAEEEPVVVESPYDRPGRWFVVHTYAGYENKVKSNLQSRIVSMNMEDRIYEVVIPMEDVVEFKNGKKVVVQKKVFPGYLLTRCDLDDDSWSVIRNTPGVTGFVGPGTKPTPLSRREVESILQVPLATGGVEQEDPAAPRVRGGRDGAGEGGAVRRLLRTDRRDQRGPAQAEGPGQHLRAGDPRRARVQPGRQALETGSLKCHRRRRSSPS